MWDYYDIVYTFNDYFTTINFHPFIHDIVNATAKIIFHDRLVQTDQHITVYADENVTNESNTIWIGDSSDIEAFKDRWTAALGFQAIDVSNLFKANETPFCVYLNRVKQQCVVGYDTHRIGQVNFNKMAAMICRFAPWLFEEYPLTDWEKKFLEAVLKCKGDVVDSMCDEYIRREHIEENLRKVQLNSFVQNLLDQKLANARHWESELLDAIAALETQLREKYADYHSCCDLVIGITANHADQNILDFVDALSSNPRCHIDNIEKTTIRFTLTNFVTNFSEQAYRSMISKDESIMFDGCRNLDLSVRLMREFYNELFVKERYALNMFGAFEIDCQNDTIQLVQIVQRLMPAASLNAIPNPHIYYYSCMGTFNADYRAAFAEHDYVDVLMTAFSEVANINWTDVSPVRRFVNDITCDKYRDIPCIWDKQAKEFIAPTTLAERVRNNASSNS